jgi:hypothetical protein
MRQLGITLSLAVMAAVLLPASGYAAYKTVTVQPNVPTETVVAFSISFPCTPVTPTNGAVTVQPKHGTVAIVGGTYTDSNCPGVSFPGVQANYTWTGASGTPGSGSDAFHVQFSSAEGTVDFDVFVSEGSPQKIAGDAQSPQPTFLQLCDNCQANDNGGDFSTTDPSSSISSNGQAYAGAPINIGSGNVFYKASDYKTAGANPLAFIRYYNSAATVTGFASALGHNWRSNYDRYIDILTSTVVGVERPDGKVLSFFFDGSAWVTVGFRV